MSDKSDWGYCFSGDNFVDIGFRGVLVKELSDNELWWYGLLWFIELIDCWLVRKLIEFIVESEEEDRRIVILIVISYVIYGIDGVIEIKGYSML